MAMMIKAGGNAAQGVTAVDNMFILDYMIHAPAEYVKVYLYGLMLCSYPNECESFEKFCSALNMDADTVKNALNYWGREGLVKGMSDNPPTYDFLKLAPERKNALDENAEVYENHDYNRELSTLMPGLVLGGAELRKAGDWIDVLHLKEDTVIYMIKKEIGRRNGKLPTAQTFFKHLDALALELANAEATTVEKAEAFYNKNSAVSKTAQFVIGLFGQKRSATQAESALAQKWVDEWKLTEEEISSACAETVKGSAPSFAYVDKVLESRRQGDNNDAEREEVKALINHLGASGRPTPAQSDALTEFKKMGFEFAAIEQAAIWCGANNMRTFDDISRKLRQFADAGAYTVEDIEKERTRRMKTAQVAQKLLDAAGVDRKPAAGDLKLVAVWNALLPEEVLLAAAEMSVGTQTPMRYMDKLVKEWSAKNIKTAAQARESSAKTAAAAHDAKDHPMITRNISEEEFGEDFYSSIMNRKRDGK